jgi:hypothetical protein
MLLAAYKRKVAEPLTPEERLRVKEESKPVPQWRLQWEGKRRAERERIKAELMRKQPDPDRGRFLLKRCYPQSAESNPIPGYASWSLNLDEGFLADGTKVRKHTAYVQVLWDMHEFYNPEGRKRPACLLSQEELKAPENTLDGYKALKV